jgi:hypothetical protein
MSAQFQSTIVLSLANRIQSRRPKQAKTRTDCPIVPRPATAVPCPQRPSTLRIKLPGPVLKREPLRTAAQPCQPLRPSQSWIREIDNLRLALGDQRVAAMAKRALASFVLDSSQHASKSLRDYIWTAERLCDREFVEMLAEVANRCFQNRNSFAQGMAAANVLARQTCDYSIEWLKWLSASIASPGMADSVWDLYQQRLQPD